MHAEEKPTKSICLYNLEIVFDKTESTPIYFVRFEVPTGANIKMPVF
jgi:hypothetical protein